MLFIIFLQKNLICKTIKIATFLQQYCSKITYKNTNKEKKKCPAQLHGTLQRNTDLSKISSSKGNEIIQQCK